MPNGQIITQNTENWQNATGPVTASLLLLDNVSAADVGIWCKWSPLLSGSMEVTGLDDWVGEVQLKMSNAQLMPPNGWTVVVGGSKTTGDVLTLELTSGSLANGGISASYTVLSGDTLATITTALTAALVAALKAASQIYSNPIPQAEAAASFQVTKSAETITIIWQNPLQPVSLNSTLSGGASETLTIAQYDDGEGFVVAGNDVTAVGQTTFEQAGQWIKAVAVSVSAGSVSCIVNGSSP